MEQIKISAPAKINLFLEITGKRPDGYHTLESIMQTVSLYDELTVENANNGILLECNISSLPCDDTNIVYKAAVALQKHFNISKGAKIYLKKEIPMGAGLGGGSSDAGAAIKALVKLWDIKADKKELESIASKLGADVPFFLTGGAALCEGIGDIITPLENILKIPLILVNPGFGVPTPSVYKKVQFPLTNQQKIHTIRTLVSSGIFNITDAANLCFNRLEDYVLSDYPDIARIKSILKEAGCVPLMSGSGATVFGLLPQSADGKDIKAAIDKQGWKSWIVNPI